MPHDNVRVLREIDEAQLSNDFDAFLKNFADDVQIHISGNNRLAGEYQGLAQFQELFGRFMEAAGEYSFENRGYFADDTHGISVQASHYRRGGRSMDASEAFVVHFRNGKVSEMWFLSDKQEEFDAWIGG